MVAARSSFGKRGGPVRAHSRARAATANGAPAEASDAMSGSPPMLSGLFTADEIGFADFHAQPAAWICGGIIALMIMTVVLSFGFSFGTLVRAHNIMMEAISGFVMLVTAGLAMAGAVYGGSMMADQDKRHNLRFAILLLVFVAELILFLVGEAMGKPKGVTWLLVGAILAVVAIWARLKQDRLFASVAELTADID